MQNRAQAMKKAAFVVAVEAMRRKLIWIEEQRFWGWGCSECGWVFKPSGSPTGISLDEMKQNYAQQRDKDFAAHVCAEHPRAKNKTRTKKVK